MRYAIRTLLRSPGFSAIAIGTIALGIAANTAIFSVVNAILLRPLPFRDEARIVQVSTTTMDEREGNHSAGDYLDVKRNNRTLEAIAGYREEVAAVAAPSREAVSLKIAWVTAEFFDVLGMAPTQGRTFTDADRGVGAEKLIVLGEDPAREIFGDASAVAGLRVRVNGEAYTVAGVMPRTFEWPQRARTWLLSPLDVPPSPVDVKDPLGSRDIQYFLAIGRLKPGVTLSDAQQDLHLIATAIQQAHPQTSGGRDVRATPIRENVVGDVREALVIIQAAVGLVLLIACANVSSLLIARATGRRRELAIRAALGASRGQLVRQLLTESLLLGAAGGAVGLLMSTWLILLLVRMLPRGLPRTDGIAIDTTVLLITVAASLVTGVLFGMLPALQASRTRAAQVIKESGERVSTRARGRAVLVVLEIALTLVLLVGAGLLANSFLRLQRVDSGFQPEQVTIADMMVPKARYPKGPDQTRLYRQLLEVLSERPQLTAVGLGFPGPFSGASASGTFFLEGRASNTRADRPFANIASVSGGYFAAMGIPLLAGRTFLDRDVENAPPVAIVSATLAKQYWPGENPIGKRLRFEENPNDPWFTVVGLVGDARHLGLSKQPPALLFIPYEQFALPFTSVVVRSTLPQNDVASLVRAELAKIDRDLSFGDITSLEQEMSTNLSGPRFRAMLMATFATLALILAAVGIFGLISYSVTQRTRDIGIRVALGAAPRQVLVPVIREGVVLALTGIALGLAGAFLAVRALSAFLFGVGPTDPLTFAGVALLLLIVATLASYIPSRRALKVDPVVALRAE